MAEMKTLNGNTFADINARERLDALEKIIEPASTDRPRIYLEGDLPVNKLDNDKLMTMTYISKTRRFFAYITAKVQGSSSTTFLKKNITIKLFADESRDKNNKLKIAFKNWPAKNKFVLKANVIDRTHARNIVSCRIFADMVKSRANFDSLPEPLRNSPNLGCIDGFPVQVYVNGVYQGLYTLNIPKDDWMAGMDADDEASVDKVAIICGNGAVNGVTGEDWYKTVTFSEAYSDVSKVINGYDWEDELGTVGTTIKTNFKALSDLIVNGTDEQFRANIATYIDMESLIDAFLMTWLDCGGDSIGKNQFWLTYNAGLPWYIGQYDLDATWGGNGSGTEWYDPETVFQDGYNAVIDHGVKNMLYERLWANFSDSVRSRWNEVKEGALSRANIVQHFEAFHEPIPVELFAEDSAPTTADGQYLVTIPSENNDKKGFDAVRGIDENNIQQIRNFAAKRWAYVDREINAIECTGITLDKSTLSLTADNDTVALVATVTPADCSDTVVWSTDNESVATVTGGYVKGIYNGSCNITATCGDYSATCAVTVSGFTAPVSANLAAPDGGDWLAGYIVESDGNPVNVNNSDLVAVSNKIAFRIGDVFVVKNAAIQYAVTGYGKHSIYNADGQVVGPVYAQSNKSTITMTNRISKAIMTEDWIKEKILADKAQDVIERGGYIRFQFKKFDSQTEFPTDIIDIHRFPDEASADAWIADNP